MEKLLNKISLEITRLENEDISPARMNADTLNDERIKQMTNRFTNYRKVLEDALTTKNLTKIIEFANAIYREINWESTQIGEIDKRIDTFKILIYILNLLTPREQQRNYLKIAPSRNNVSQIINILNANE